MDTIKGMHWIEEKAAEALLLLKKWSSINSWSGNPAGLANMAKALTKTFLPLSDTFEEIGENLCFSKRQNAKRKILLGGHMDTVYPPSSPFQKPREEGARLIGPGVADMKGGLVVLWLALSAFEKFKEAPDFGWDVVINSDEEIGSQASRPLWEQKAKAAEFGLLFEPSFPDGSLVTIRKGSMNFHLLIRGKPAHAGRDFHHGRSAIKAIALFITEAYVLASGFPDLSLNAARLKSDFPLNVVAEEAFCSFNIRSFNPDDLKKIREKLEQLARQISKETETESHLSLTQAKQPKLFKNETEALWNRLQASANSLGLTLTARSSGGLSDGNILAEAGLPCLDSLGVIGGCLHTPDEYMEIKSMVERAKLVFHFLCEGI